MDRRQFNTTMVLASFAGLIASSVSAQQTPRKRPRIGMLVYSDMILLDLVGPLTVFNIMQADIHLIGKTLQPVIPDVGLPITPTAVFELSLEAFDVLFVPGGLKGTVEAMKDAETTDFLKAQGGSAGIVTSVCTGSLLLGAAGLLRGYRATSHWYVRDLLPLMGAIVQKDRVVEDRNRVTAGGVTAGIDFALTIAARLTDEETAKRIQLLIEYDPKPPFDAGSPEKAGDAISGDILRRRGALIQAAERAAKTAGAALNL
jgi:transcriptional regulator GlxA family with amidase domain